MDTLNLPADAREWLEAQLTEFMQPQAAIFRLPNDADVIEAGWYSRLSAPGYTDCTDWSGPFDSEEEALIDLHYLYGD